MTRLLISPVLLACLAAQVSVQRPDPPVMPGWLVPYPGVSAQTRQSSILVESTYTAPVPPHDLVTHYRKLFASAGLRFQPSPAGYGFMIRADAPECHLFITIRRRDPDSDVRVTCAAKVAATGQTATRSEQADSDQRHADPMKKFDKPVYPEPKPSSPPVVWPAWLVRTDGAALKISRGVNLTSSFTSNLPRASIQSFYADLLNSHGYRVTQSVAATPSNRRAWVEGSASPEGQPGRRVVIWVELKSAGEATSVEFRLTAYP